MTESMKTLFVMSRGRENGLNKAYPNGKQTQVQYINLAWMNEIGKKCDTRFTRRNKNGNVVVPHFWSNKWGRTLAYPCKLSHVK
jgi:hypothetical protein